MINSPIIHFFIESKMDVANYNALLAPIYQFLQCETPDKWIEKAKQAEHLPMLLLDHLICELKAGQTAMWLIKKYAADKKSASAATHQTGAPVTSSYLVMGKSAHKLDKDGQARTPIEAPR